MKVPVYDGPQVREAALPGAALPASSNPDAFGAAQGRQLQQVGTGLMEAGRAATQIVVAQNEQEDADTLFRAESALKKMYLDYQDEALTRTRLKAWNITKDTERWWADTVKQNAPSFKTARAGQMFQRTLANMQLQSLETMSRHERQERNKSLVESASASIAASTNWAVANPTGDSIAQAEAEITKRAMVILDAEGMSGDKDTREQFIAEKIGVLHKEILKKHVNRDATAAKAYYESYKEKIPPADRTEIEKTIELGRAKQTAPLEARRYISSGMTEAASLKDVRERFASDPNIDIIEREVKQAFAERESARRDRVNTLVDNVSRDFAQRWRPSDVKPSDLAELEKLDGSTWSGFKAHMEAKIKSLKGEGSGIATDYKVYNELYDMAGLDPQKFAGANILAYRGKLKDSDYEELKRLQLSVRNAMRRGGEQDANSAMVDLQNFQRQLQDTYDMLGWNKQSDAEKIGLFSSTVADVLRSEEARVGRKLRDEERQVIINKMASKEDAPWYRKNRLYFEALREGKSENFKANITIKDVPPSEREKITAALQRKKTPVTEQTIIELYKRKLGVQ